MKLSYGIARAHRPRHVNELSELQHAQLTAALELYDGGGLTLEERFAEEGGAFDIHLNIRELVDERGAPAFDAVSFAAEDGAVFVSGTTNAIATLVQGDVQTDTDALAEALQRALQNGDP